MLTSVYAVRAFQSIFIFLVDSLSQSVLILLIDPNWLSILAQGTL